MLYQNIMNQTKKKNLDAGASSANPTARSEKLFFRSEK
jgi:hypothetical protein